MTDQPHIYRLLAVFSGIPTPPIAALKKSGLWADDDHAKAIPEHLRGLLRTLKDDGRIRWVTWGPDGPGYVLTGLGESALDVYHQRYGPALAPRSGPSLAEIIRQRKAEKEAEAEGAEQ